MCYNNDVDRSHGQLKDYATVAMEGRQGLRLQYHPLTFISLSY